VLPWKFLAWAKRIGIEYPAELEKQVVARGHQIADWKSLHDEVQAQYAELNAKYDETEALLAAKETHINSLAGESDALRSRNVELEQALKQAQAKEKPLSTRQRETALKLIIGMAVTRYGYDPSVKRSDKISEIVNDLDSAGVSLDDDTVRKWLREAADQLPR
jgi:septal ring factor EnvC (AmiA/AmiB activator)